MKKKIKTSKNKEKKISKKMNFSDILEKNPELAEELMDKGMHCFGCPMAMQETLEEGALAHGLDPDEVEDELNKKLNKNTKKKR
jgi:hybrid cluster-associated redox disulfide protein